MFGCQWFLDLRQILNHPEVYYIHKNHEQVPALISDKKCPKFTHSNIHSESGNIGSSPRNLNSMIKN